MKPLIYSGILLAIVAACARVSMPEPPEGRALYVENCAMCHGPAGQGNGDWAAMIEPRPADLTRLNEGGRFDRARVLSIIDGYDRTGLPGHQMPEFGALLRGDTVPVDVGDGRLTPTPRPLAALLVYLESIQRVAPEG
ncbi:cytochrome c [Roseovarius sp. SCSIO 43702]|uniref:c-type cytochrome n=1 Tax=Roseovarius sp. SCSIO 43702 TaxID=2823043 RepID=UPI001C72AE26|nr:c-type cytochrome [Roseovarius sp. SCSIO 43702]QYX57719.1 cytochrome c [Roseovarius sp. SCSIO 43702]